MTPRTLYTIGHSNHEPAPFLALLRAHGVRRVADVRSRPRSRWPQFGRERFAALLAEADIAYVWLGEALGGKPEQPGLARADGTPDYAAMAARPAFGAGIAALLGLLDDGVPTAILCSEGDPQHCHREHLIARALRPLGVAVRHILRDGRVDASVPPDADDAPAQLELDV